METMDIETVIVGTGASGYNAADVLSSLFVKDFAIITEGVKAGTSRNTGSDKQTYYKLSLSGMDSDSVRLMAADLFNGQCVDGDNALVEASLSAPSFIRLSNLGVPFPQNRYGEYIGYKTDHDPYRRATSVGPYTSKLMTEALERSVMEKGVRIIDGYQMVRIIVEDNELKGAVFVERKSGRFLLIRMRNLILATGGPAGMYMMSVYPSSQFGASGIAFEAGCKAQNLTEWQYGLASVRPRWNVSGSYMQVLPRILSIDSEGEEHDFLFDYPIDKGDMLTRIFLKGYQWPFDVRKLYNGSSVIDILCYLELEKGRRVFFDYIHNPLKEEIDYEILSPEARDYLYSSSSIAPNPVERLRRMNEPAYQFYLEHGVDLEKEYLEISLSAQHNNGGIAVDAWWRSSVEGIFAVGEAAGTHGVYRPGGSALNAGQVGSKRASEYIAMHRNGNWVKKEIRPEETSFIDEIVQNALRGTLDLNSEYDEARLRMSLHGSCLRNREGLEKALAETESALDSFSSVHAEASTLWKLFEYRTALVSQKVYLSAMLDYASCNLGSRGSAVYSDEDGELQPPAMDDRFRHSLQKDEHPMIQMAELEKDGKVSISYRKPRPIPQEEEAFEVVWARYRKDKCIF